MNEKIVTFHCAVIGKPFEVILMARGAGHYKFHQTRKARARAIASEMTETVSKAKELQNVAGAGQIDWSGFICHWYRTAQNEGAKFIQCGSCTGLVCAGSLERTKDGLQFRCYPRCGAKSYLRAGVRGISNYRLEDGQARLPHHKQKQVTNGRAGRLLLPSKK